MENIKKFVKKNWIYLLIFIVVLGLLFYSTLSAMNFFKIIKRYITDEAFRNGFCVGSDIDNCRGANVFEAIYTTLSDAIWRVEVRMIFGTRIFQVLIPFFGVIEGVKYYRQNHSIFKYKLYRAKNYRWFMIKDISKNALFNALAIFCGYLIFYLIILIASNGTFGSSLEQHFLIELLGENFYQLHPYLYYFIDGFARFFVIPFIYAFFAQSIALIAKNNKQVAIAPLLYFFGMSAIGSALYAFVGLYGIYFSPLAIMTSEAFVGANSYLLIFSNSIPVWIGFMIIQRKAENIEI